MNRVKIPVSRIELKQLFNFLASGLKDINTAKYLALADMTRYLTNEETHYISNAMRSCDLTSDQTLDFSRYSPELKHENPNIKIIDSQ